MMWVAAAQHRQYNPWHWWVLSTCTHKPSHSHMSRSVWRRPVSSDNVTLYLSYLTTDSDDLLSHWENDGLWNNNNAVNGNQCTECVLIWNQTLWGYLHSFSSCTRRALIRHVSGCQSDKTRSLWNVLKYLIYQQSKADFLNLDHQLKCIRAPSCS